MSKKRSFASHLDLLPHARIATSIAVIIFGVPARNAECVHAIAEGPGVSGDHLIDFAVALRKNVRLRFAQSFTTARGSRNGCPMVRHTLLCLHPAERV